MYRITCWPSLAQSGPAPFSATCTHCAAAGVFAGSFCMFCTTNLTCSVTLFRHSLNTPSSNATPMTATICNKHWQDQLAAGGTYCGAAHPGCCSIHVNRVQAAATCSQSAWQRWQPGWGLPKPWCGGLTQSTARNSKHSASSCMASRKCPVPCMSKHPSINWESCCVCCRSRTVLTTCMQCGIQWLQPIRNLAEARSSNNPNSSQHKANIMAGSAACRAIQGTPQPHGLLQLPDATPCEIKNTTHQEAYKLACGCPASAVNKGDCCCLRGQHTMQLLLCGCRSTTHPRRLLQRCWPGIDSVCTQQCSRNALSTHAQRGASCWGADCG